MTADPNCFDFLKKKIATELPKAQVIASSDVTTEETISLSIEQQAEKCYQALLKIPDIEKKEIILIGHSQGGLRVCKLLSECKQRSWNVKGVVALSTPFKGVPILNKPLSKLLDIINTIEQLSESFNLTAYNPISLLKQFIKNKNQQGVKDLEPNSSFLSKLKVELCKETVPILAIAAVMPKFPIEFMDIAFEEARPWIVGHSENTNNEHDMIVPVTSQLGASVLPKASKDLQKPPIHALHWSVDQSIAEDILHSNEMATRVTTFAKHVLT